MADKDEHQAAQELLEQTELGGRRVTGKTRLLAGVLAVAWSLFQLYSTYVGNMEPILLRAAHLAFAFSLAFLVYPFSKRSSRERVPWADWLLGVAAVLGTLYIVVAFQDILLRGGVPNRLDVWTGTVTIVLLLAASWRALGPALPIIAMALMVYAATGPRGLLPFELPRMLQLHAGAKWDQLVAQLYLSTEGIFGTPLGVSATFVFLFVLFGAFLDKAGAGNFFIQLAYSLLGNFRGGPAKAAVVSSALTGVVSGSSVSNVVTTGTFTIPLMKRIGYSPEKAGGIEVASSSNGQLMPPVMGAAAFIMANFLNISYTSLILAAAVPAVLAYAALFVTVHIEALKLGLKGVPRSELPPLAPVLRAGAHYFIPIIYLIYALAIQQITPERAALNTIGVMVLLLIIQELVRAARRGDGLGLGARSAGTMIVQSLETGARNMVGIALATAAAGIIVGMVTITGIGFGLTDIVQAVSGGNLIVVLIMAQLISLLLGMGLPTTANYIVMASLIVPVISNLAQASGYNVPPLAVHMFVFYFGIMADSTPPVALAGYAAAAIGKGNPFRTGVQGFIYELRTARNNFV